MVFLFVHPNIYFQVPALLFLMTFVTTRMYLIILYLRTRKNLKIRYLFFGDIFKYVKNGKIHKML